jgi:hypothetical protein
MTAPAEVHLDDLDALPLGTVVEDGDGERAICYTKVACPCCRRKWWSPGASLCPGCWSVGFRCEHGEKR